MFFEYWHFLCIFWPLNEKKNKWNKFPLCISCHFHHFRYNLYITVGSIDRILLSWLQFVIFSIYLGNRDPWLTCWTFIAFHFDCYRYRRPKVNQLFCRFHIRPSKHTAFFFLEGGYIIITILAHAHSLTWWHVFKIWMINGLLNF